MSFVPKKGRLPRVHLNSLSLNRVICSAVRTEYWEAGRAMYCSTVRLASWTRTEDEAAAFQTTFRRSGGGTSALSFTIAASTIGRSSFREEYRYILERERTKGDIDCVDDENADTARSLHTIMHIAIIIHPPNIPQHFIFILGHMKTLNQQALNKPSGNEKETTMQKQESGSDQRCVAPLVTPTDLLWPMLPINLHNPGC